MDFSPTGTSQFWMAQWIEILAFCSVDLFAILSGYLGVNSKKKSSKRAIELLSISFLYCVLITFIFLIIYPEKMDLKNIAIGLFPFLKRRYWYLYCYIPLAILQPYINFFIASLSLKQHRRIISIILLMFSVVPSVIKRDTMGLNDGYSFMWLFICYFIGAYIKRQEKENEHNSIKWGFLYLFLSIVLLSGNYFVYIIRGAYISYFVSYTSPIVLLMAICLLLFFKNMRFKKTKHKVIETLSILSFDIYLLHCHVLIFDIPWNNAFTWVSSLNAIFMPFVIIGIAVIVAVACLIPAYIRNALYKRFSFPRVVGFVDKLLYE